MGFPNRPLSWSDLLAFRELSVTDLSPGDAEAIMGASLAYVNAINEYNCQPRPAPYGYEVEQANKVAQALRDGFRGMMAARE